MQDNSVTLTGSQVPPIITIGLVSEAGQPPWWCATFRDITGAGPQPADALDNLLKCITESVLTRGGEEQEKGNV
jgi:hypothetical protein